ncbi:MULTISPECIES: YceI family protein [Kordiimonas]|jgi:polyisoprenoid-binding protein YceI|uniref:YceI family protein n=1 Tax=Kordiimonas TaxID=288021 RepID=UPI00257CCD08|nr:YceI family protein [Kordiimonas sp. UBA4487]
MTKALRPTLKLMPFLLLAACAAAAKVLYPVNEDAFNAKPGDYLLDGEHATVIFGLDHMGFSTFYGRFDTLEGRFSYDGDTPTDSEVAIRILTASVNTGSSALDEDLRGKAMFDSAAYPAASFISTKVTQTGEKTGTVEGLLTIKDVTKPVTLAVTFGGSGTHPLTGMKTIGFNATGMIRRSDFGLSRWLPFVGDEVSLIIEAEFTRK